MHRSIKALLEEYLSGTVDAASRREVESHLRECEVCRREVEVMRSQSAMLRLLKFAGEVGPAPGFYARVLQRIESQRVTSIWELLVEPVFARRVAYASLMLILLFSALLMTGREDRVTSGGYYQSPEAILAAEPVSPYLGNDVNRDRDVMLVNLATYEY